MRSQTLAAAVMLTGTLVAASACRSGAAPVAPAATTATAPVAPTYIPDATVKDLMLNIVDTSADVV